jgi:hypothetical protein
VAIVTQLALASMVVSDDCYSLGYSGSGGFGFKVPVYLSSLSAALTWLGSSQGFHVCDVICEATAFT